MEVKIGQMIWVMILNKPVEIIVSKITEMTEMADKGEIIRTKRDVYASYSLIDLEHDYLIDFKEAYSTKEELMNAVFELKNREK